VYHVQGIDTVVVVLFNHLGKGEEKMNIILWIVSGVIAGWLTGMIVKGKGYGLLGDLIIGLLGGLVGGWVAGLIGISAGSWLGNVAIAVLGGVILVAVVRVLRRA
jgi:uncharacterized membrane protein YeaQ/YmgE (transglycosylase-associated protein family)